MSVSVTVCRTFARFPSYERAEDYRMALDMFLNSDDWDTWLINEDGCYGVRYCCVREITQREMMQIHNLRRAFDLLVR